MKALVVFYSLTGNTRMIAEIICEAVNADILELRQKQEFPRKGFAKYFQAGKAVMQKDQPELLPLDKTIDDYDLLFIGSPVWAWTYAPALNSFFSGRKIKNKKIALFCSHGGGKGKIFEQMKEALSGNEFAGSLDLKEPLSGNRQELTKKIRAWAKKQSNP